MPIIDIETLNYSIERYRKFYNRNNVSSAFSIVFFRREYWLKCFEEKIDTFVRCAVASQPDNNTAQERAEMFKDKYITRLHHLKIQPLYVPNVIFTVLRPSSRETFILMISAHMAI